MYSYHHTVKKRIRNGELRGFFFTNDYPGIGECLVLSFNKPPFLRPIRPKRYGEYEPLLTAWKAKKTDGSNEPS
ncbi:MAG: hypothetical protein IJT66_01290 [Clostridia bacterium]|nr:hypothetical protein [Clostridia bacterium]